MYKHLINIVVFVRFPFAHALVPHIQYTSKYLAKPKQLKNIIIIINIMIVVITRLEQQTVSKQENIKCVNKLMKIKTTTITKQYRQ